MASKTDFINILIITIDKTKILLDGWKSVVKKHDDTELSSVFPRLWSSASL